MKLPGEVLFLREFAPFKGICLMKGKLSFLREVDDDLSERKLPCVEQVAREIDLC